MQANIFWEERSAVTDIQALSVVRHMPIFLPFRLAGTDFQQRVWREIARIPYGKTISYSELARRAGNPQAIRAAGMNTGRNPLSVIIPCHRVVAATHLGGYSGGDGLPTKRWLLNLENPDRTLL